MELEGYQLQSIKSKRKQTQLILSGPGNDPARTIECNDIWGFRLDGALFRIEPEFGQPALVVLESSPCYYENGAAHLKMYLNGTTEATVVHGSGGYLSHGLNDAMTGVSLTKEKHTYKAPRKFLEERPEYAPILPLRQRPVPRLHATGLYQGLLRRTTGMSPCQDLPSGSN